MRHRAQVAHFGRRSDQRKALIRSLVISLVEHGRIETTVAKAKELRRHAERAVTLAKNNDLNTRRLLLSRYPHETTVESLMANIAPRFTSRPGGYTRIIKLGKRQGDKAEMAFIEWVDYELPSQADVESKAKKSAATKKTAKKKTAKKSTTGAKKKAAKKSE